VTIKAIVFDADGVLFTGEWFSFRLEREYGLPREQTRAFFHGPLEECILGRADLREVLPPFLEEWGWPHDLDAFLREWFSNVVVDRRLLDRIARLRQHGLLCCLATNQDKYRVKYMKRVMGFDNQFDHVFSSSQIGCKKTDRAFFQYIEQALDLHADALLLWDDSADNVHTARSRGWYAELYVTFDGFQEAMERYVGG
jgi:putative hydrolase of the HAD superfamily